MANVKDGSDFVTIRDYQGLPLDALHSDGHTTQDYRIMGSPPPPTQPGTNDSFAAMYIALRDVQAENKRLQQQLSAERAKKLPPQLQPAAAAGASTAVAATASSSSLRWPWQPAATHDASSSGLPGAATGPPLGHHLQQRSASSPATIASLDFSESAVLLGRLHELEEASRRWTGIEDTYKMQIQGLQVRIEELRTELERLKKALTASRSMASPAAPQLQDSDSGFTTTQGQHQSSSSSTLSSSSADRRWSSVEDSYKRQIQELSGELARLRNECVVKTEQLEQYKDELEVLYSENDRLKRRLSVQAPVSASTQQYPDSGLASAQGLHTSSSTTNSSQELSTDAMQTIMLKVQKSREAVNDLKGVVLHQTEIIKNFKLLFDRKCKQQGDIAGGCADAHSGFEASAFSAAAPPQQNSKVLAAPRKSSAPTAAATSFATVSPACFSYALQPSQMPPRVGPAATATRPPAAAAAAGSALSAQVAVAGRQAVEQSDQSRSLGPYTTVAGGDDTLGAGWVKDGECTSGTPRSVGYLSTEAYDSGLTAEEHTLDGNFLVVGSSTRGLPVDTGGGGTFVPAMVSHGPRSVTAAAAAVAVSHEPPPGGGNVAAPPREHRVCPVCNTRFSSLEPLERLQEHILDCEGTSAPLPVMQQQQPTVPGGIAAAVEVAGHSDDRTCPMCNAHFPPELPQREYELHVMSHFEEDYIVAGREPLPSSAN